MSERLTRTCPQCTTERDFTLTARTNLHLGLKTKWHCPECGYGFVRIDDVVDTSSRAGV